jgi:hypothetical protein
MGPPERGHLMSFETSGRKKVERRATSLRRGWLRRRDLKSRDLSPAAGDLLGEWSEARARLELGDDRGEWGDRWQIAAQNSVARLASRLEDAVVVDRDPVEEMRKLLSEQQWVPPATVESEDETDAEAPIPASGSYVEAIEEEAETSEPPIDFEWLEAHSAPVEPPQETHRPKEPVSPLAWHSKKGRKGFVDINIW